ncbi:alpha/beta fold hydrolase [Streptomyces poriferorum]|uniref:Alpha/beta hydrolase n=1 Tax=Streptomyces poriferorum TaxID=2798799 RepID=A0ABY9IIE4_9ACTN|nr:MULTISPECIES: alpha/beta fold hydrolase [unclassified Streptomyces]MDP5316330.1 alpha/beta hydrolase [Streptomyces sp. Alt4]WLQ54654.1 alpha/beta hydrolase [Streptomyces sp. Alt2]
MPPSVIRSLRLVGRLLAVAAAVVGLVAVFVALIVATDGAGSGLAAWSAAVGIAVAAAMWRGRRRPWRGRMMPLLPVLVAAALTLSVCVPTVPTTRQHPPALSFVTTEHWRLSTGSRVAVYHYPPTGNSPRKRVPLVYLNGGPVRGISLLDHRFLQRLAGHGYDVYAYEQAGGGRSDLLPMDQYSITRSVHDLGAFVGKLGRGRVDVLGFSSGAVVLTRALADPATAAHLRRAVVAEPGPMDGPTARITGQKGRPSARGVAPAVTGPRSTQVPRYAVAFGLMRLGLLSPDNGLVGQAEGDNAFTAADPGSDTASAYCAGRAAHPGRGHGAQLLLQRRRQPSCPANDQRLRFHHSSAEALPDSRDADDRRVLLPGPAVGDDRPRGQPRHPTHPVHARRRPPHVERPGEQRPTSGSRHHRVPPGRARTAARLPDPG